MLRVLKLTNLSPKLISLFRMSIGLRVFVLALLILLAAPLLKVARCYAEPDPDLDIAEPAEGGDIGIVGDDVHDFSEETFNSSPGIETVTVFPKNIGKQVVAGEETELLVGLKNNGEATLNVIAITASVHLPYDHRLRVQNLTAQGFNKATVPVSAQATFPYIFAVSKYLQAGTFDLVGTIIYEIDQTPYQSTFYNGTIEVVESGNMFSVESVFLVTLGIALLGFLGIWVRGQIQHLSKKSKRAAKVEVGTKATDTSLDEWLEGTAYTRSLSSKIKKKNK